MAIILATHTYFPRTRGIWMNSQGLGMAPTGTSIRVGSRRAKHSRKAHAQFIRIAGAPAGSAEALRIFHEIGIGKIAGDQPVAELLLLDATHIAEGAVDENDRHQRYPVANGGGEFVAGVEKSAVAVDREHRHVTAAHAARRARSHSPSRDCPGSPGEKNVRGL